MIKRLFALLLLLLCLTGCGGAAGGHGVQFFYPRQQFLYGAADGVIARELRQSLSPADSLEYILQVYLRGPETEDLRSPFPAGTSLAALSLDDGLLILTLTDPFFALEDMEATLAQASLTLTCLENTEASTVLLRSEDNDIRITFNSSSFVFLDDSDAIKMTIGTESQKGPK